MDKVDFYQGIENALNTGVPGGRKTGIRRAKNESRQKTFSEVLEHSIMETPDLGPLTAIDPSEEAVQNLLDEVRSAGDSLKRRPLPQEMLDYKKTVRNFLNYVVKNSYEIQQFQGIKRKIYVRGEKRWDSRIHHQIRIVDQKLEQLASEILLKQINDLDLNARLEEITGLLVDFTISGKITEEK